MRLKSLLIGVIAAGLVPAWGASAAPVEVDHQVAVTAGEVAEWDGEPAVGANINYFNNFQAEPVGQVFPIGQCSQDDPRTYCEYALIALSNPVPEDDADGRLRKSATIKLDGFNPVPDPVTDFDLLVYESDAEGTKGTEVGQDGSILDADFTEVVTASVTTTRTEPVKYLLAEIVYYASPNASYHGTVQF